MTFLRRDEVRLTVVFVVLLVIYLAIAYFFFAPLGYYGTRDAPRFADPWLQRTSVILEGGLLYRDTFTATPPLTNYLLVPPSLVALRSGTVNPYATLSFMIYFSLFNLLAAWLLLHMAPSRRIGLSAAMLYLLNPLTFSNTVLRRQDESVLVFFVGLALLLFLRRQHGRAAISVGFGLLVKLSAALFLPIAALHSRLNWRYFLLPILVFALAWLPFYFLAGESAVFWDFSQQNTQHPFQLGGISLGSLWNRYHLDQAGAIPVSYLSALFLGAVIVAGLFIFSQRVGVLADFTLLVAVVLLFVPKLHAGYFSILAFAMVLLVRKTHQIALFMVTGLLVVIVDFYKWPIENFPTAFWLMLVNLVLLTALTADLYIRARREVSYVPLKQWFFPEPTHSKASTTPR